MKFLTQWLLVFLTVLNPIFSSAALTDFDRQELPVKNWLAPYNSGFESSKAKWTASGGTFAAVTSGTNLLVGKGSATWDGSSASQTLTSQTITIEKGYYGQNCEAGIVAQVPSGTATHTVQAYDGTNILVSATIVSSTTPRLNTVNFPCPQSGTVALRLVTVASDEPLIAVDDAYLGLARNVGGTQLISEWTSYTPTIGLTGGSTTAYGKYRRVGDSVEVQFDATFTTIFTGGTASVSLPSVCSAIDTAKLPTGYATGVGLPNSNVRLYDVGTGQWGGSIVYNDTTTVLMRTWTDDVGAGGNHIQVDAAISTTIPFTWVNNDRVSGFFKVPCTGWTAQTIVMPNAQGWYVDANISGANPSLGTSNVSSYTEITNGSLTMTPRTGSAAAGIMCSSTNAAATPTTSTSTCSAGSESLGLNAVIPVSGAYEVCADFSHYMEADQAEGVNTAFQIVQTPTNAQTITTEGGSRKSGRNAPLAIASGTAQAINVPYTVCGIFQLSAGTNGFRLMYEQLVTGTPNGSEILADELSTVGQRNLRFTIKPINSQQQAILANSVSTGTANGDKIGRATIANSGSASITSQSTGFLSSVSYVSTGVVDTFFTAGYFSAAPSCTCTARLGGRLCAIDNTTPPSTSGARFWTGLSNTAAEANVEFQIICVGPR